MLELLENTLKGFISQYNMVRGLSPTILNQKGREMIPSESLRTWLNNQFDFVKFG